MELTLNMKEYSHIHLINFTVTKVLLLTIEDIKISLITFNMHCSNSNVNLDKNKYPVQYLPNFRNFC